MAIPESVEEQTRNCLRTIGKALEEAGFALADVVRCHYYVTDRAFVDVVFPDPWRDIWRDPTSGRR
jgi:enamine deaminase RidA (YjgF/YER057c/UK114 family)